MTQRSLLEERLDEATASLESLQSLVQQVYGKYERDQALLWLMEEVGELAAAVRKRLPQEQVRGELADVCAWALCLVIILDEDISSVVRHALLKEGDRQIRVYGKLKHWQETPR